MAYEVELARAAARDRDETIEYLLTTIGSRAAVVSFFEALSEVLDNLGSFPFMYPASREPRLAAMGYRKAACGDYLVLYRVEGKLVKVARVFHQRQDYARLV